MAHFIANAFNAIAFYRDLRLFRIRTNTFCPFFLFKSRHKILTIKFVYIKLLLFFPLTTVDCFQLFSVILMIDFEFSFLFTWGKNNSSVRFVFRS